jgi:hypothetical protein
LIPAYKASRMEDRPAGRLNTLVPRPASYCLARLACACRSARLRLSVALQRDAIDGALAQGADPGDAPEVSLRAARLVRDRDRRALASTLRLVVRQAEGDPWLSRVNWREIQRAAILADRQELVALIERLESPRPAVPEGVAIAERLMSDLHSPLFAPAEPGTIRRLARRAVTTMDPPLRI